MGEDMVSHSRGTRARAAKVCGAGLARETGKGTALDADPCEGLEEPAGVAVPGAACGPTLEELECRVAEQERAALSLASSVADVRRTADVDRSRVDALRTHVLVLGADCADVRWMRVCVCALAVGELVLGLAMLFG